MKVNPLVFHVLFVVIAICSLVCSFPDWFVKQNDAGEISDNWIVAFIYLSSIAHLKIELSLFLNLFGIEGNAKAIFITVSICVAFLIASALYFSRKSKGVIRVLKFGILLIGYNAFFSVLFFLVSKFSNKLGYFYEYDTTFTSIPYMLVVVIGNVLLVYASIVYFKYLNQEKQDTFSGQANVNLEDSIFSGIGDKLGVYTEATVTQRFFNYLVDYLIMLTSIFKIAVFIVYSLGSDESYEKPLTKTILYIASLFAFLFYYFFMEKLYGVTLGKIITNTRVVQEDGNYITWKQAAIRSLSRLVPLEWASAFKGYPWHDQWSRTYVVKEDIEYEGIQEAISEHTTV